MNKSLIYSLTGVLIVVILVSVFVFAGGFGLFAVDGGNEPTATPISTPTSTPNPTPTEEVAAKKPFYVGVTYCGNSTQKAKELIDKVKSYTNLFVLQSGPLMEKQDDAMEICDYAVDSGLNVILYYSSSGLAGRYLPLINMAQARWGSHFLGVYYNDEPGGKMLDSTVTLYDNSTGVTISKGMNGWIQDSYIKENNNIIELVFRQFMLDGQIIIEKNPQYPDWSSNSNTTTYFPNGTISFSGNHRSSTLINTIEPTLWYQPDGSVQDENGTLITNKGDISMFEPYQQVLESKPLKTEKEAARVYVNAKNSLLKSIGNQSKIKLYTSDYGLYWYDYLAGYDTVFAQLGWKNNPTQEIALVRGAANMQNKSWGTIITWESHDSPFLQTGEQMYEEMVKSYESGAEFVVVFNYTPDYDQLGATGNGTRVDSGVGLLEEEHFVVMNKFWNEVVQNPKKTNNVTVEAAFVLPSNYGGGLRNPRDTNWGIWNSTSTTEQIWNTLHGKLDEFSPKIDVVIDNLLCPLAGKYSQVYYWNQTG